MVYPYRLEPIVNLFSSEVIGYELLAGKYNCPVWNIYEWRNWYIFLESEVPLLLSRIKTKSLFINMDGNQLLDAEMMGSICSLNDFSDRIVIEWTEQKFHDDHLIDVMSKLNFLKGLGYRVAIDDIGAGSGVDGLGRAGSVKSHFCKIDGPYFQTVRDRGPEYLRDLCRHLAYNGTQVIVEWVENESDYHLALASGAHLGQGFYWKHDENDLS